VGIAFRFLGLLCCFFLESPCSCAVNLRCGSQPSYLFRQLQIALLDDLSLLLVSLIENVEADILVPKLQQLLKDLRLLPEVELQTECQTECQRCKSTISSIEMSLAHTLLIVFFSESSLTSYPGG